MIHSPRKKKTLKKESTISPKSNFNTIYVTSTKDSPYHENPILPMSPPPPPLTAAKQKSKSQPIMLPNTSQTSYQRSPRNFASTSNFKKGYKNQTELLNKAGKMHNEKTRYTFKQKMMLGSSYRYDHSLGYEMSKIRTQQILNDHYNKEKHEQKYINRQSKAAIEESYQHDLFYEDNMYSTHNKSLRIIPVTNRLDSLYPVKEQKFI